MNKEPIVEYKNPFEVGSARPDRQDRIRAIGTKTVRVWCNTNKLVVEGVMLDAGVTEFPVYADRLHKVEALVEKFPEKVAEAKRLFEAEEAKTAGNPDAKRSYTSWPQAYGLLTGGLEPQPFDKIEVLGDGPPPKSDEDAKAEAMMNVVMAAAIKNASKK